MAVISIGPNGEHLIDGRPMHGRPENMPYPIKPMDGGQSSGFQGEVPTMIQMFNPAKGARGGRLGRASGFGDVMTQYGYGTPGANITVSPTFSNIGNPNVTGPSVGDVTIGGGGSGTTPGGTTPGGTTPGGTTPGGTTPGGTRPGGTTPRSSGGGGGGGGGGRTSGSGGQGLKAAMRAGQENNPRVTRTELKGILEGKGPKGVARIAERIENKGITLGGKAQTFLEKQLGRANSGGGGGKNNGGSGGSNRSSSSYPLQKNLSTGGGIGTPTGQSTSRGTNAQRIQQVAGDKLTRSEVKGALQGMSANKVLNQIEKGNITAGKKAIAKVKAAKKKGK